MTEKTRAAKAAKVKEEEAEIGRVEKLEEDMADMKGSINDIKSSMDDMKSNIDNRFEELLEAMRGVTQQKKIEESDNDSFHSTHSNTNDTNHHFTSTTSHNRQTPTDASGIVMSDVGVNQHSSAGMGQTAVVVGNIEKMETQLTSIMDIEAIVAWRSFRSTSAV